MLPSTIMSMGGPDAPDQTPPEFGAGTRYLMAALLGLVAGPLLAFFQWRTLRHYLTQYSIWWLPANAAAWALGMPVIFLGAHVAATAADPIAVAISVAVTLAVAGAVVGVIHGRVLIWLLAMRDPND